MKPSGVTRYDAETLGWNDMHSLFDLKHITAPLCQSLVVFAIQTGLRRSKILGIQWRDVDLSAGTLSVRRALIKLPSGETELNAPKNGKGRVVDLLDESLNALQQWRCENSENGNFVFCLSDRSLLDPGQVTPTFKRIAGKAVLTKFKFRDLQHTLASLMLFKGIHLMIASERLGHSNIANTVDLYFHVLPADQRGVVRRLGSKRRKGNGKFFQKWVESTRYESGEWMGPGGPCGLQNRIASYFQLS